MERTLVLLKPDSVQRGLVGTIISRFESKGLKIVGLKMRQFPRELLEKHYEVHNERPFYPALVDFMSSSPVVAIALEGKDAIETTRNLTAATNPAKAAPGTIRGDLGMSFSNNLVHGSDGADTAQFELGLWFADSAELSDWTPANDAWVYSDEER